MDRPRRELLDHVAWRDNLCLNLVRQTKAAHWMHALVANKPTPAVFLEIKDGSSIFPLYLYAQSGSRSKMGLFGDDGLESKRENFTPAFRAFVDEKYGQHFSPDTILAYTYAVLYSPTYRERYLSFLKGDFPRIPFVDDVNTFENLARCGDALIQLHLLEDIPTYLRVAITKGTDLIEKAIYRSQDHRLYVNSAQYFSPVVESVWNFQMGGYRVLDSYLKAREGRTLTLDDVESVINVTQVLHSTIDRMQEIDRLFANYLV